MAVEFLCSLFTIMTDETLIQQLFSEAINLDAHVNNFS